MTPQDAKATIKDVDTRLNKLKPVTDEEKRLSLTALYGEENWPAGSKLSKAACLALAIDDVSEDTRWNHHFEYNRLHLGLYRSKVGFYWILICEGTEHVLEHVGAASDVLEQYKNG